LAAAWSCGDASVASEPRTVGPAFYARRGTSLSDWWNVLHPPYTIWHLSYVVIGAALAPNLSWTALAATLLAFFLAVGVAAHALDELHGRPLGTQISARTLRLAAGLALSGSVALGIAGVVRGAYALVVLIPVGVALVLAYNLELRGGRLHNDLGFAVSWGGFPVLVAYAAQQPPLDGARLGCVGLASLAAIALSHAQRRLSTPARNLRRRAAKVTTQVQYGDGSISRLGREDLLAPLEGGLKALSWAMPLLAFSLLLTHLA
jgi:hypothetical protein